MRAPIALDYSPGRTSERPLGWQDDALCAQVGGDEWFPDKGSTTIYAKRICAACPVLQQCRDYALSMTDGEDRDGVLGGLSVRQRRAVRRARAA